MYAGLLKVPAESARLLLSPLPLLRASGEDKGGSFTSESLNRKHNQISLRAAARCKVTNCLISLVLAHSALLSSFILLRRTATFPFFTPRDLSYFVEPPRPRFSHPLGFRPTGFRLSLFLLSSGESSLATSARLLPQSSPILISLLLSSTRPFPPRNRLSSIFLLYA